MMDKTLGPNTLNQPIYSDEEDDEDIYVETYQDKFWGLYNYIFKKPELIEDQTICIKSDPIFSGDEDSDSEDDKPNLIKLLDKAESEYYSTVRLSIMFIINIFISIFKFLYNLKFTNKAFILLAIIIASQDKIYGQAYNYEWKLFPLLDSK